MDYSIIKYPRTQHLEGSRLQKGDEDLSQVPFSRIFGKNIVIEEKMEKLSKRLTKRQICDYVNNHQNKVIVRDKNCEKHKYNAHIARASNGEEIVVIDIDVD